MQDTHSLSRLGDHVYSWNVYKVTSKDIGYSMDIHALKDIGPVW